MFMKSSLTCNGTVRYCNCPNASECLGMPRLGVGVQPPLPSGGRIVHQKGSSSYKCWSRSCAGMSSALHCLPLVPGKLRVSRSPDAIPEGWCR